MSPFDGQNDRHLISLSAVSAHPLGEPRPPGRMSERMIAGRVTDTLKTGGGAATIGHGVRRQQSRRRRRRRPSS